MAKTTASSAARTSALLRTKNWYLGHAPVVVSWLAAVLGVMSVIDAFWRHDGHALRWFSPILPFPARATAAAVVAVSGLLLMRIAAGLRRRKRTEWRVAIVICLALSVAHLFRDERHPLEATVTLVLLVALLSMRTRFTARADPHSRWFAVRVAAQILVAAFAYGIVWLSIPGRVIGHAPFVIRLREVVLSLVGLGGYVTIRGDRFADVFHTTMLCFGLLALCSFVFLLLRPPEPAANLSSEDEARLRQLVRSEGWRDSLAYFALRRDKSVLWSASGKSAITYRVVYGVALASGDPIGDPEAWPGAIAAYRRLIEEFGWTPAVVGCSERGARVFRREYGLSALSLGDEAVVKAAGFGLDGRAMRGTRQACGRLERDGYTVQIRRVADVPADEVAELRDAAERWRGNTVERGFSMALSRLGDPEDGDCVVATAHQHGELRGLLHFVPWGKNGLSLDLMRRDRDAANGLNELMIAQVLQRHDEVPLDEVSLNFAAFRDPLERGQRIGAGPLLRARRSILVLASRWWQIDSLYRFNAKFQPEWLPRFLCFPSMRDVPRIALAALEAEAFIVRPTRLKRLLGRA